MTKTSGRLLAAALGVWLAGASAARAEYMGWTYSFEDSSLAISPNAGQNNGSIGVALPMSGSATAVIPNVILEASTGALGTADSPADQYVNVPYSVTLTIADPAANQSHDFTFNGLVNGSAVTGNFQITNSFPDGATQDSTVAGHDYQVTAGPFVLSSSTGAGSIAFAVQVSDPITPVPPAPVPSPSPSPAPSPSPSPSSAPEPASLLLACLTLPLLGLTSRKRNKAVVFRS